MPRELIKVLLFITAVTCIIAAALASWRRRRTGESAASSLRTGTWWRGERGSVNPGIGGGWLAFVFLNGLFALTQPLFAASLFVRAYILRAVFLRKGR